MRRLWHNRHMMRRDRWGKWEWGYYFCSWSCFLSNGRFCKVPERRAESGTHDPP